MFAACQQNPEFGQQIRTPNDFRLYIQKAPLDPNMLNALAEFVGPNLVSLQQFLNFLNGDQQSTVTALNQLMGGQFILQLYCKDAAKLRDIFIQFLLDRGFTHF